MIRKEANRDVAYAFLLSEAGRRYYISRTSLYNTLRLTMVWTR